MQRQMDEVRRSLHGHIMNEWCSLKWIFLAPIFLNDCLCPPKGAQITFSKKTCHYVKTRAMRRFMREKLNRKQHFPLWSCISFRPASVFCDLVFVLILVFLICSAQKDTCCAPQWSWQLWQTGNNWRPKKEGEDCYQILKSSFERFFFFLISYHTVEEHRLYTSGLQQKRHENPSSINN